MPRLPSRPHDPGCQSAQSWLFAGHRRHIMIQPTRLLIDLAKNSKPSSQRSSLISRGLERFAPIQEPYTPPYESTLKFPTGSYQAHFRNYLRFAPSLVASHSSNKTHRTPDLAAV